LTGPTTDYRIAIYPALKSISFDKGEQENIVAKGTMNGGANLGFEAQLRAAADALRGSMDASEHKHVVLGRIFLKYISDAFEEQHAKLEAEKSQGADPEDPDEHRAKSIFWAPPEARWSYVKARGKELGYGP
jgi:type I restriction enzyme M protein